MTIEQNILDALRQVIDPELQRNVVELGMIRDLTVQNSHAHLTLVLTIANCPFAEELLAAVRQAVASVPGITDVTIATGEMSAAERNALYEELQAANAPAQPATPQSTPNPANHIGRLVAIMSGKGGVGKSSVTALLAAELARKGFRVGVLDADMTGPSIPKLFDVHGPMMGVPFGIVPAQTASGIKVISLNLFLEDEDAPVIWRGPLISGTLEQLWNGVFWGELDYLLVDMPPGTSDAALTVMQSLPLNGVVMVTTPQQLASMIVRKAVRMAQDLNVPVLGVIENMSYFQAPDTGVKYEIFGPSFGDEVAIAAGANLLGKLPLDPEISRLGDNGQIESYHSDAYAALTAQFLAEVPEQQTQPAPAD